MYVRTYMYIEVTCRINYDRRTADAMSHGPISFIHRRAGPRRSSCNFEDCAVAYDDDRRWHRRAIDFRFRLGTAASKINDISWLVSRSVSNESRRVPDIVPEELERVKKGKTVGEKRAIVYASLDIMLAPSLTFKHRCMHTYRALANNHKCEIHDRRIRDGSYFESWQKFPLRLRINF